MPSIIERKWPGRTVAAMLCFGTTIADSRNDITTPLSIAKAEAKPFATATVSDVPVKIGKAYSIRSVTYLPQDDPDYDEVGYASWYGEELKGARTASGEKFIPSAVTAAHRTLPMPSYVEVTSLDTGRTVL